MARTVKDEILEATKPQRHANESDSAYWNRVVGMLLKAPHAADGLSPAAHEYLRQFKDDDGDVKREMFEKDEDGRVPSIQTPDDFDDMLLLRARGGPAPTGGSNVRAPLANVQAGQRISFQHEGRDVTGMVTQNTGEFLAVEVDGYGEHVFRTINIEQQTASVIDDGGGSVSQQRPNTDPIDVRSGKKKPQPQARGDLAAAQR